MFLCSEARTEMPDTHWGRDAASPHFRPLLYHHMEEWALRDNPISLSQPYKRNQSPREQRQCIWKTTARSLILTTNESVKKIKALEGRRAVMMVMAKSQSSKPTPAPRRRCVSLPQVAPAGSTIAPLSPAPPRPLRSRRPKLPTPHTGQTPTGQGGAWHAWTEDSGPWIACSSAEMQMRPSVSAKSP